MFEDFARQFNIQFQRTELLKLALTHRSYLSVTGQSARESNERLEFLGDSVLGLVTSEFLYREHPNEHEGQLTKTKSLLVSKAILSRRALAMGLGKFVLMSRSESDSGGRQRLSILADAFESVIGAIYLDQGFEAARHFIMRWLLRDSREIASDKRHTNYKSHLQEYVQSTYRTHPVYRIRSEMGPDHSKQFNVEVLVGRRVLGSGRGRNKKDAEQAAARNALEQSEGRSRGDEPARPERGADGGRRERRPDSDRGEPERTRRGEAERPRAEVGLVTPPRPGEAATPHDEDGNAERESRRRGRRGGRGRRGPDEPGRRDERSGSDERGGRDERASQRSAAPVQSAREARPETHPTETPRRAGSMLTFPTSLRDIPAPSFEDDTEEIGRPEALRETTEPGPWRDSASESGVDAEPDRTRHVGGRSVERLGRPTWRDEAPPVRVPERHVAPEPADASEPEPVVTPIAERESDHDDVAASSMTVSDPRPESVTSPAATPAPVADERNAPAFGRRRSRR